MLKFIFDQDQDRNTLISPWEDRAIWKVYLPWLFCHYVCKHGPYYWLNLLITPRKKYRYINLHVLLCLFSQYTCICSFLIMLINAIFFKNIKYWIKKKIKHIQVNRFIGETFQERNVSLPKCVGNSVNNLKRKRNLNKEINSNCMIVKDLHSSLI